MGDIHSNSEYMLRRQRWAERVCLWVTQVCTMTIESLKWYDYQGLHICREPTRGQCFFRTSVCGSGSGSGFRAGDRVPPAFSSKLMGSSGLASLTLGRDFSRWLRRRAPRAWSIQSQLRSRLWSSCIHWMYPVLNLCWDSTHWEPSPKGKQYSE